jgi:hypothetical protein
MKVPDIAQFYDYFLLFSSIKLPMLSNFPAFAIWQSINTTRTYFVASTPAIDVSAINSPNL